MKNILPLEFEYFMFSIVAVKLSTFLSFIMHEAYNVSLIGGKIQLESFDWPDFRIILFRQIITFIKVRSAIVFGL